MTIDAAFAALAEANPIPDPRSYAEHKLEPGAFLTATRERTTDMQTIDQQESGRKSSQRRWQPLAAVAAFVNNCSAEMDDPGSPSAESVTVVVTIDDADRITAIEESFPELDMDRIDAWSTWLRENEPEPLTEHRQLWGPDPVGRPGADIGRDWRSAGERFDAQYDG